MFKNNFFLMVNNTNKIIKANGVNIRKIDKIDLKSKKVFLKRFNWQLLMGIIG